MSVELCGLVLLLGFEPRLTASEAGVLPIRRLENFVPVLRLERRLEVSKTSVLTD